MKARQGYMKRRAAACVAAWILAAVPAGATLSGWGDNTYGQRTIVVNTYVGARAVGAGYWHTLVVISNGTVVAFGRNDKGQATVPPGLANVRAVSGGRDHSLALRADGTVVAWGDDTYGQTNVPPDLAGVAAISAGGFHNLALRSNGTVCAWGYAFYGQANTPADLTDAAAVAAGNVFSLALCSNGTVRAWGDNYYHQTDVPADLSNVVAIAAGFAHALAVRADGGVVMWGDTSQGQGTVPASLTNAVAVAAGRAHSLAMTGIGRVVAWGTNDFGQTTVPAVASNALAVAAGFDHSLALKNDAPLIWSHPTNLVARPGTNVNFKLTCTGINPAYLWYFNGARLVVAGASNELRITGVAVTNAGDYFCVVTNMSGTATSRVATLTVNEAPGSGIPTILSSQSWREVDPGGTATFSVTATGAVPLAYAWFHAGAEISGATGTSHTVSNAQPADAGPYWAIVTNGVGAATSSVATLTIRSAPAFVESPRSLMTNIGATVTLMCNATGSPPIEYLWRFNGAPIEAMTNTLWLFGVTTNHAGSYVVIATNSVGSATSQVAVLQVVETVEQLAPVITREPSNRKVTQGQTAVFDVVVQGAEPILYQWRFNEADLEGSTGAAHTVASVQPADAGGYSVIASNDFGAVTSRTAVLSIGQAPTVTGDPQGANAPYGSRVDLVVQATGSPVMMCYWYRNGAPLGRATQPGSPMTLASVTLTDQGSYHAIVTNWAGSATSGVAVLTVYTNGLSIVPCRIVSGGSTGELVRLTMELEAGCNYRVQCSTNMVDWDDVTNFLSQAATADFMGRTDTNSPLHFFRVVSP